VRRLGPNSTGRYFAVTWSLRMLGRLPIASLTTRSTRSTCRQRLAKGSRAREPECFVLQGVRLKSILLTFAIAWWVLSDPPPAAAESLERLKGYSITAQSTMRLEGKDKGRIFVELNTRSMQIYVSSAGRIFDYSKVEDVGARSGQFVGGNSGLKVVQLGEEWFLGNVGQRWDLSNIGLVRTRIYPWGNQIYTIRISHDLSTCVISEEMRSKLADKRFFLFQWSGHTISEVTSHETASSSCSIFRGNFFDGSER
jgi:hypothetical protein